jgi:hypothetical protein
MAKVNLIQTDFTSGEISLKCMGRVDLNKYAHAAELMRNYTISPQGGAIRRSGTRFVAAVPNSVNFTRLIEFRFSTTDAAVIEFSNELVRFYINQGIVFSSGTTPYSISSPYLSVDLPLIKVTQSADIIYLFHPKYPTQLLSHFADNNWTIANMVLVDGPYLDTNYINGITQATVGTTLSASNTTVGGSGTLTASHAVFVSTDVGRSVRLYNAIATSATQVGWLNITGYTSATSVTYTCMSTLPAGSMTNWNLGAISATTGYPSCGTFYQQRLVMANTPAQPSTFFMSNTGDIYNFGPSLFDTTVTDSCGITYTVASNQVNSILWFSPSAVLMMGTDGAEWEISSNSYNSTPITPTNIDVALQTGNGSQATSRPLRVGWETLFVARSGRDVFTLVYEFQVNGFQAKSLTLLGEHIPREGNTLTDMAYQQFPHSIMWFPRQRDGLLAGMTYLSEQQIIGWHLHTLGGEFAGSNAVVESVAVIPTPDGTKDQLWLVVKRTINGSQVRFVEYMESPFDNSDTPVTEMCFMDAASSYSGSPETVISGLSYLQGQSVAILADGNAVSNQVVTSGGTITLPIAASNVTVGLPYQSTMKVLRLDGGGSSGTAQGKLKRTNKIVVRFFETLGVEWSVDGVTYNEVDFRDAANPMGSAPPLKTGDVVIPIDMPVELEGQYWLQQSLPYPCTILALMPESMVNQ